MVLACRKWRTRNVWWWKCWKWEPWRKRHRLLLSTWALDGGADLVLFAPGRQDLRRSGPLLARHRHRRRQPHRHRRHTLWRLLSYLNTARRCSDSAFAISIPHGAAATARVPSQYRTALQPQRFCYLNTARRCSDSACAISIPYGAAATALVLSQYRTALQREASRGRHEAVTRRHEAVTRPSRGRHEASPHRTALQPQRFCYLNIARPCSHSAFPISIPHGAAAIARLPSQYRTSSWPMGSRLGKYAHRNLRFCDN